MTITVLLGLASAFCWGAPDVWLAQATRSVGTVAVLFGSILVGFCLILPGAFFVDTPEWTARGVGLAVLVGVISAFAYRIGFSAFRDGSVAVVAPIIACEGAVAAVIAIAAGEDVSTAIALFLPIAVAGVVLAAMGRGGGRAAVVPAVAAALLWGTILALSVPVADDLGVYWGFLLIRATALLVAFGMAIRAGVIVSWTRDWWKVAAWGVGDSVAYLLYVAAADRGPAAVASVLAAQFATVAVFAGLISGERPLPRQIAGIVLVILAVTGIAALGG
jgi:drug/metabolite transporter (DMT)-like permease